MAVFFEDQISLSKEIQANVHQSESEVEFQLWKDRISLQSFSVSTCPIWYPSSVVFAADVRLRKLLLLYFQNVVTAQPLDTQTIKNRFFKLNCILHMDICICTMHNAHASYTRLL